MLVGGNVLSYVLRIFLVNAFKVTLCDGGDI